MSNNHYRNESLVLKVIQDYMDSNRYFKINKLVPIIKDRFAKGSININSEGIKVIIKKLKEKNTIVEGSKLTRKEILENLNRKKIYNFIRDNPGINFNRIATTLDFSVFLVEWHLNMLIKFNYIRKKKIGNFDAYFPVNTNIQYDEILHLLSREKCKKIVIYLRSHDEGCSKTQLSDTLKIHFKTTSKYLNMLDNYGFINIKKDPNKNLYFLDSEMLKKLERETDFIFSDV